MAISHREVEDRLAYWIARLLKAIPSHLERAAAAAFDQGRAYVTGGSIASLLNGESPRDIDVFFTDEDTAREFQVIADHMSDGWATEFARTVVLARDGNMKFQFVTRFVGEPDEVHKTFDFLHAMGVYRRGVLMLGQRTALAISRKSLEYVRGNSKFPVTALMRVQKFRERGYRISAENMKAILLDIQALNLADEAVAHAQMMGVYTEPRTEAVS